LKRIGLALCALVVVGLIAGCGGGGSSSSSSSDGGSSGALSKAELIDQADAVCTESQAETAPLRKEAEAIEESSDPESPENLKRLAEILQGAGVKAEKEYAELRELQPPAADEKTIDAMLGKAEAAGTYAMEGAEALEDGELSEFSEIIKKAAPLNEGAKEMAESYGFKVCGQIE
jgi:uncharacterized membrane protein YqiK